MGRVILLNGGSSSGKSAIARILQETLDGDWLRSGLDHWLEHAVPPGFHSITDGSDTGNNSGLIWVMPTGSPPVTELRLGTAGLRLLGGAYHAYAAFARAGVDVIVDDVLFDRRLLTAALAALSDVSVLFVGVRCPAEIAASREAERGDRELGLAAALADAVHAHASYDLEVDTSELSADECASLIRTCINEGPATDAFDRLRSEHMGPGT